MFPPRRFASRPVLNILGHTILGFENQGPDVCHAAAAYPTEIVLELVDSWARKEHRDLLRRNEPDFLCRHIPGAQFILLYTELLLPFAFCGRCHCLKGVVHSNHQ
jgi:hypothetical protein